MTIRCRNGCKHRQPRGPNDWKNTISSAHVKLSYGWKFQSWIESFNLQWTFQSRWKVSIPTFIIPHKKAPCCVAHLEFTISIENFNLRLVAWKLQTGILIFFIRWALWAIHGLYAILPLIHCLCAFFQAPLDTCLDSPLLFEQCQMVVFVADDLGFGGPGFWTSRQSSVRPKSLLRCLANRERNIDFFHSLGPLGMYWHCRAQVGLPSTKRDVEFVWQYP